MRIVKAEVSNFGSYKHLAFSYENLGLTLVYGRTGSGKSTLADIVPWVLYGVTAKDGTADEVRSWTSYEPTQGTVTLELADGQTLEVTRIRGKASQNDLFFSDTGGSIRASSSVDGHGGPGQPGSGPYLRGKDLQDTQKQLNALLGCDAATFALGAYVSEFSATGSFFTTRAAQRRTLLERIADTGLAARLADRSADARKEAKARAAADELQIKSTTASLQANERALVRVEKQSEEWTASRATKYASLTAKANSFDQDKAPESARLQDQLHRLKVKIEAAPSYEALKRSLAQEIKTLDNTRCNECGGPKSGVEANNLRKKLLEVERASDKLQALAREYANVRYQIKAAATDNHYLDQLKEFEEETDPYAPNIHVYQEEIKTAKTDLAIAEANYRRSQDDYGAYTALQDLSVALRGELVRAAVTEIQDRTNQLLEDHFDAEIRVSFTMDGDSIDVSIYKSGHEASFTQLSKGQRGLLKLCFSVAVMEASSNQSGIHMSYLAFDESLDGLDQALKTKAYDLLSSLSERHEAILVIDHDQGLHQLFPNKIQVFLDADESTLTYE